MAITDQFQERIKAVARELSEEFGEIDDSGALSLLDAIETRAIEIGDAVTAELVHQKSASRVVEDESTCPQCGKQGRYQGQRQRDLIGRRGPVSITEPEYYCPTCRRAFFPADQGDRC
jgi:hypothetical protein